MNKVYGRIVALFLLIVVISSAVIYFTVDINTITNLYMFKPWSVIMAILAMVIGLVLDGTRLMHMVRISDENITLEQAVQVVFGNYFLAMLGPGAAAGCADLPNVDIWTNAAISAIWQWRGSGIIRTSSDLTSLVNDMEFLLSEPRGITMSHGDRNQPWFLSPWLTRLR